MKMRFADFHNDTITVASKKGLPLFGSGLNCDLKYAENFSEFFNIFAIFIPENLSEKEAYDYYKRNIDYFYKQAEIFDIAVVKNYSDFDRDRDKIRIMLSIENFSVASERLIEEAYSDGVRIASLSWNADNSLVGGAEGEGCLTEKGKEIIRFMEKRKIALDISHLNFESAKEVLSFVGRPIIATHSSSFEKTPHLRNLKTDDYLSLTGMGGVAGVNFYREFLGGNEDYKEIAEHIAYYYETNPEGVVFGSDFDGAELPDGISGLSDMRKVYEVIEEKGIDPDILYRNAENFIKRMF